MTTGSNNIPNPTCTLFLPHLYIYVIYRKLLDPQLASHFQREIAREMKNFREVVILWVAIQSVFLLFATPSSAQLKQNYYSKVCPNVEFVVRNAVTKKFMQTFVTIPGTLRLFFHDCFVNVR